MKKKVVIFAMLIFLNIDILPMLIGTSSPAPESKSSSKTTEGDETPILSLISTSSNAKQLTAVQPARARRCCSSFLSEVLTHLGNLQPQTSFGVIPYHNGAENDK